MAIISSLLVFLYLTVLPAVQYLTAVCTDVRPFTKIQYNHDRQWVLWAAQAFPTAC